MAPLDRPSTNIDLQSESDPTLSQDAWSFPERGKAVVQALGAGTINYGLESLKENPGGFALETVGGAALGLALKGPAWIKAPALLAATVGTTSLMLEAKAAADDTAEILKHAGDAPGSGQTSAALEQVLGPLAFNGLSMYLSGHAASRLAHLVPAKASLGEKFRLEHVVPGVGLSQPEFAFAHVNANGNFQPAAIFKPKLATEGFIEPSRPTIYKSVGHEGSEPTITYGKGSQGEALQRVEHLGFSETAGFHHQDGTHTQISGRGKIAVEFATGEGRMIELGKDVRHIVSHEYNNGLKQYRLNGASVANLEVSNERHVMRAVLGNGDHLQLGDNVPGGYVHFAHRDGLQSWVEYNGKLTFQMPGGRVTTSNIGRELAHIKLLEKDGGGAQFRFLDADGRLLPEVINLPPIKPHTVLPDELLSRQVLIKSMQNRPHNYYEEQQLQANSAQQQNYFEEMQEVGGPIWEPKWPESIERGYAKVLAGVDNRTMRGNDLTAPADMALAQQNHSWLVRRYLYGLNPG